VEQLVTGLADQGISPGLVEGLGDAGRQANVVDPDGTMTSWVEVAADT
jgi:hypothetical protein